MSHAPLFGILFLVVTVCTCGWPYGLAAQLRPAGERVWAMHVTMAPSWFDPADERVMFAPVYDLRGLMGVGYRVAERI